MLRLVDMWMSCVLSCLGYKHMPTVVACIETGHWGIQGSLCGIKQSKYMVNLRDFPIKAHCLGWCHKKPLVKTATASWQPNIRHRIFYNQSKYRYLLKGLGSVGRGWWVGCEVAHGASLTSWVAGSARRKQLGRVVTITGKGNNEWYSQLSLNKSYIVFLGWSFSWAIEFQPHSTPMETSLMAWRWSSYNGVFRYQFYKWGKK